MDRWLRFPFKNSFQVCENDVLFQGCFSYKQKSNEWEEVVEEGRKRGREREGVCV